MAYIPLHFAYHEEIDKQISEKYFRRKKKFNYIERAVIRFKYR